MTKHGCAGSPDGKFAMGRVLSEFGDSRRSIVRTDSPGRDRDPIRDKGQLFVLSGPSGVGKDAVLSLMRENGLPLHFTVTATTRPQRLNEVDGVDYFFYSDSEFAAMMADNAFLESAIVYGYRYGVPKGPVNQARDQGIDVIIKADIQGAASIRTEAPDAVLIFLDPPDIPELTRRLTERMTESSDALKIRIATAQREMVEGSKFDHRVVNHNGRLDDAVAEIEQIISDAKSQPSQHNQNLETGD